MSSESHEHQHDPASESPVSGLDGMLCPVCGEVVDALPVLVHRVLGDSEERFQVCSVSCREIALRSPYLQTSLFGRDLRVWSKSAQAELPLSDERITDRRNGRPATNSEHPLDAKAPQEREPRRLETD